MALLQCSKFFQQHPQIRLVEADDTAQWPSGLQCQWKGIAAIASQSAAQMYQLTTLSPSIQTIKTMLLACYSGEKSSKTGSTHNKTTMMFTLDHQRGFGYHSQCYE